MRPSNNARSSLRVMAASFSSPLLRDKGWDFPGGPVVKTSPSNEGGAVPSLVGKLRSHMPLGQKPKTQNRSNIVTNSIKTLKMAHTKKKQKPKKILAEIFNCND